MIDTLNSSSAAPTVALLERLLRWVDRRAGCFELDGPVVIRHDSAWLRIAPGEQSGWYRSEAEALYA